MSLRGCTHPGRSLEGALLGICDYVSGLDEVGREALAGPVNIGLAIVAQRTDDDLPEGLADSKQLTARARTVLIEPVRGWLVDHAITHTSPAKIDEHGIIGILRVAGLRVLQQIADRGYAPGVIILDGMADWFTIPQSDLLTILESTHTPKDSPEPVEVPSIPPVRMEVEADARCTVIVAASVLAKVGRDRLMVDFNDPGYGWASNKDYISPAHIRGLTSLGASDQYRRDWHLPGLDRCYR